MSLLNSPKTWIMCEVLIERHTDKEVLKVWTMSSPKTKKLDK